MPKSKLMLLLSTVVIQTLYQCVCAEFGYVAKSKLQALWRVVLIVALNL